MSEVNERSRLDEAAEVMVAKLEDQFHWTCDADGDGRGIAELRSALLASLPVLLGDVETVVQQMTDYLDQDVDPDFDVISTWRDQLARATQPLPTMSEE